MMETKNETSIDNGNRYRKFGLPNWMVNNIERLNFVTDFEQYACSPPETESFLSEHNDNCEFHDTSEPYCPVVIPNDSLDDKQKSYDKQRYTDGKPKSAVTIPVEEIKTISTTNILANAAEQVISPHAVISNIMNEELFSSPDTTPCPTPEPSPAPRRRMSGQQDTVQTNPGRWFYLGNLKKTDQNSKGQCLNINSNKENRMRSSEKSTVTSLKLGDSPMNPKKNGIKLVISDFDINAVSPSSW